MAREKNLSHKWLGKKSSPKARPRESIHEIRAAGGLRKVELRWLCRKWHAIFGKAISDRIKKRGAPIEDRCPGGFFYRPIHGSIKKRGGPISDRGPRGDFFPEPSMAKPNVQIRRIWTFAKNKIYLLRRPSFFFPTHLWVGEKNGFSSDFEEIGGNNGSFRAPISDRCPEGTSKTRESEGTRRLPSKIACDFRRQTSVSSDFDTFSYSGSPQISLESEGTAVLPISSESERKARFYSLCPAGAEEKNT